jgi:monofunctional glycosyltransferase
MKRLLFMLALLGFLIYLLWPYDVFQLVSKNPRTTSLIELRKEEARQKHIQFHPQMIWKNLNEISPEMRHAIILSEDDTFYQHHGFDWEQIQIAFQRNWQKKRYVYGGSTITQQLARTLYLRPRKSIIRKIKEAVLTVYLEATLSKKRILELYLNVAEWGTGIFGVEAAAQAYFHKSAADLTPDEAVALASVLPSPRRWSPISEKAFMARRRTQLLERMAKAGYLPPPAFFLDGEPTAVPLDPNALFAPQQPTTISEPPPPEPIGALAPDTTAQTD